LDVTGAGLPDKGTLHIAIASGKGGTGKTTIAVNLARALDRPVRLIDADVEEPNAHLFLKPEIRARAEVSLLVPRVNADLCTRSGDCARACRYHAIVTFGTLPLVFPELCHGCGACAWACRAGAIEEVPHVIGTVYSGTAGLIELVWGTLDIGQPMAVPVIRAVKRFADRSRLTLLDCPPGTSCPMVTAVRGSDFVVLVTEPTPFGLHDLGLAAETLQRLDLPCGVVINRSGSADRLIERFCAERGLPILMRVADDRRIAEAYSRGILAIEAVEGLVPRFRDLYDAIVSAAGQAGRPSGDVLHAHV